MALNRQQKNALSIMEEGYNLFLSGEAGTGKSYVINKFIDRNKDKNIIVTAPTGIAAINVGGSTLHRTLKIPVGILEPDQCNRNPLKVLEKADCIIIDEISMCRLDLFSYAINTIRYNEAYYKHSIQIIVVGDFLQLPPVVTENDSKILNELYDNFGYGFAFQSGAWGSCDFKTIVLDEVVRQSESDFITNLNRARIGDFDCIRFFNDNLLQNKINDGIFICGTNKEVKKINENKLKEFKNLKKFIGTKKGKISSSDMIVNEEIEIAVGVRVMSAINDKNGNYQNGSLGTVINIDPLKVKFDNGNVCNIDKHEWKVVKYIWNEEKEIIEQEEIGSFKQIPLKIAYAITIHKSQGQTYDSGILDPSAFAPGQLYVGLSRVKNIGNLGLKKPIKEEDLICSSEVLNFYKNIKNEDKKNSVTNLKTTKNKVGRKSKYKCRTKTIRVPEDAIPFIMELINSNDW